MGETGIRLSTRLMQHNTDLRNRKDLDSPIIQHFLLHGPDAIRMAGLQGNSLWTMDQRRRREKHWILVLGAISIRPQ